MPLNRAILQGRVLTSPVDVPDSENRIRFALAVPRPPYLPSKRGGVNADHLLVEVVRPPARVRSFLEPGAHVLIAGFLEHRDSRRFGLVVRAQYISLVNDCMGVNEVIIKGSLAKDPLMFLTRSRRLKVTFRLAVPRPHGIPDTPQLSYMSVEVYGDWVKPLATELRRGVYVLVYAYLQSRDDAGDAERGWPLSLVAHEVAPLRREEGDEKVRELDEADPAALMDSLLQRLKEEML